MRSASAADRAEKRNPRGQPRPRLGFVPWLALRRRARVFALVVRFDMAGSVSAGQ
jgi:hypothetical protein